MAERKTKYRVDPARLSVTILPRPPPFWTSELDLLVLNFVSLHELGALLTTSKGLHELVRRFCARLKELKLSPAVSDFERSAILFMSRACTSLRSISNPSTRPDYSLRLSLTYKVLPRLISINRATLETLDNFECDDTQHLDALLQCPNLQHLPLGDFWSFQEWVTERLEFDLKAGCPKLKSMSLRVGVTEIVAEINAELVEWLARSPRARSLTKLHLGNYLKGFRADLVRPLREALSALPALTSLGDDIYSQSLDDGSKPWSLPHLTRARFLGSSVPMLDAPKLQRLRIIHPPVVSDSIRQLLLNSHSLRVLEFEMEQDDKDDNFYQTESKLREIEKQAFERVQQGNVWTELAELRWQIGFAGRSLPALAKLGSLTKLDITCGMDPDSTLSIVPLLQRLPLLKSAKIWCHSNWMRYGSLRLPPLLLLHEPVVLNHLEDLELLTRNDCRFAGEFAKLRFPALRDLKVWGCEETAADIVTSAPALDKLDLDSGWASEGLSHKDLPELAIRSLRLARRQPIESTALELLSKCSHLQELEMTIAGLTVDSSAVWSAISNKASLRQLVLQTGFAENGREALAALLQAIRSQNLLARPIAKISDAHNWRCDIQFA